MEEIKKEIIEKVILVAVADQDTTEAEESLDELEELVKTAGAEVAARVIQVRETPHPGTYIGKGKIDEVNALLYGTDATGIVCDGTDLSNHGCEKRAGLYRYLCMCR